jgi:hypothetical protein
MHRNLRNLIRAAAPLALLAASFLETAWGTTSARPIRSVPARLLTHEGMLQAAEESRLRPDLLRPPILKIRGVNDYGLDAGPPRPQPELPAGPDDREDGGPPIAGAAVFDYTNHLSIDFAGPGPGGGPDPMIAADPTMSSPRSTPRSTSTRRTERISTRRVRFRSSASPPARSSST